MSLYTDIVELEIPHDNHYSDLYIPITPTTSGLLMKHDKHATQFRHQGTMEVWYDIPFAYEPYWDSKMKKRNKESEVLMKILNYTRNPITVFNRDVAVNTFDPVGFAQLREDTSQFETVNGVTVTDKLYEADSLTLPDEEDGTLLIVPSLIASLLIERNDLIVPLGFVRDQSGNKIGCRGFYKIFFRK